MDRGYAINARGSPLQQDDLLLFLLQLAVKINLGISICWVCRYVFGVRHSFTRVCIAVVIFFV